jgi:hypothetical protein
MRALLLPRRKFLSWLVRTVIGWVSYFVAVSVIFAATMPTYEEMLVDYEQYRIGVMFVAVLMSGIQALPIFPIAIALLLLVEQIGHFMRGARLRAFQKKGVSSVEGEARFGIYVHNAKPHYLLFIHKLKFRLEQDLWEELRASDEQLRVYYVAMPLPLALSVESLAP